MAGTRRPHPAGITALPTREWVTERTGSLLMILDEFHADGWEFLIRDWDTTAGARIVRTSVRAPRANAIAEGRIATPVSSSSWTGFRSPAKCTCGW
jgi:putative transposase